MNAPKLLFLDIDGILFDVATQSYVSPNIVMNALQPYFDKEYKMVWITNRMRPSVTLVEFIYPFLVKNKYDWDLLPFELQLEKFNFLLKVLRETSPNKLLTDDDLILQRDFVIIDDRPDLYLKPAWASLTNSEAIQKIYHCLLHELPYS